ncbi:MAG: SDR family oxidoreductase [Nevskia sp.]|nr:SDR family oxidoreductase [Nevskia sp.]
MDLKGKVVVVTGGAQGIGRAIADMLAAAGARLALFDVNATALESAGAAYRQGGTAVSTHVVNVADEAAVEQAMDAVVAAHGRLDGLVNNAGILRDALLIKVKDGEVTGRMSLDQWRAVIDVNLTGVFLCGRAAAERMIRLGNGGVIVGISSISRHGNAGQSNYSAAKAGVAALTIVWARELARYGIRTGAIAPGFVATEILHNMKPEALEKALVPIPLKRLGEASEIAHGVRFIFENDFFTGRCLDIDGGLRV